MDTEDEDNGADIELIAVALQEESQDEREDRLRLVDRSRALTTACFQEQNDTSDVVAQAHSEGSGRQQQGDDIYTIAKNGGKHSGWYNQFKDKAENEIRRGIRSIEKQIQEHQEKIVNPRKYIPSFDSLTPQEQAGLIKRK
jgi:hypothetical protein